MEINATRLALWQTASRIDQGEDPRASISMLKVQAAEMLGHVVDRAVQIFGGMGVCQDTLIPEVFTVGRFCRIADGPDEVHMSQLGKLTARELTS